MTASNDLDLTASEKEAIEELRKRIRNEIDQKKYEDDFLFYRFLKARDFNINQAESMLRKHLQWRKKHGVDTILEDYEPPEVLRKYSLYNRIGFDKEGGVIRYVGLGTADSKGLHASAKYCDIEKDTIYNVEQDEKITRDRALNKKGKMQGFLYIYNMKNLSFALACDKKGIETIIRLMKMYQDNYPERLRAFYLINVSNYFAVPFSITKNFLANNVLKKIHVFGAEGWQQELLKNIDADQLPAFLGGARTDPDGDPTCRTLIHYFKFIPESYYLQKRKASLSKDPDSKKLVLPRSSFSEIVLEVQQAGSMIEWEFQTKTKDVGFGVFLKEKTGDDEKVTELVPLLRMDTENFSETGMYKCDIPGTYILLFDNSYSWIRSKEIIYKATVVSPAEHEAQMVSKDSM